MIASTANQPTEVQLYCTTARDITRDSQAIQVTAETALESVRLREQTYL